MRRSAVGSRRQSGHGGGRQMLSGRMTTRSDSGGRHRREDCVIARRRRVLRQGVSQCVEERQTRRDAGVRRRGDDPARLWRCVCQSDTLEGVQRKHLVAVLDLVGLREVGLAIDERAAEQPHVVVGSPDDHQAGRNLALELRTHDHVVAGAITGRTRPDVVEDVQIGVEELPRVVAMPGTAGTWSTIGPLLRSRCAFEYSVELLGPTISLSWLAGVVSTRWLPT